MGWTDLSPEQHEQLNPSNGWASLTPEQHQALASNPKDISIPESFARGAVNQFGIAPAVVGAEESYPEALGVLLGKNSIQDVKDAYNKHREESLSNFNAAEKAHPIASFAGNLAGGIVPAYLTGGASELASGAEGLNAGQKIANTARVAGMFGAGTGLGSSISEGDDAGQTLHNTVKGGLYGAAIGGALKGLPEGVKALGKAVLPETMTNAAQMGFAGEPLFTKAQQGAVKAERYATGSDITDTLSQVRSNLGAKIKDLISNNEGDIDVDKLSNKAVDLISQLSDTDTKQAADKAFLLDAIEKGLQKDKINVPVSEVVPEQTITNSADSSVKTIPEGLQDAGTQSVEVPGANNKSADELYELKQLMQQKSKYGDYGSSSPQGQRIASLLAGDLGDTLNESTPGLEEANSDFTTVDKAMEQLGIKPRNGFITDKKVNTLGDNLSRLKSNLELGTKSQRRFKQAMDTLSQYNPDLAEEISSQAKETALRNETAREAGNAIAVKNGVVEMVKGAGIESANAAGWMARLPQQSLKILGDKLSNQGETGQLVGRILNNAADKDDIGKNALIFTLMQNPGYREFINKNLNQKQE